MFSAVCPVAGNMTGGGVNAMIGPIGLYLLRFPGAVPPPKTALRSRSCRRPSDTECAAPFRLNCLKKCARVFNFFLAKIGFQKLIVPRKNLDVDSVFVYFQNFQNHNFSKIHVL